MSSNITLSAGVRQNLLSLQNTASLMSTTQNRLATGKKVNSALDNPHNFFTSQSLSNRAGDLNSLLDSIGQAQQTLKAADQGITALSKQVEALKAVARQAQQASSADTTYAMDITGSAIADDDPAELTGTVGSLAVGDGLDDLGMANGEEVTISDGTNSYTFTVTDASTETLGDLISDINTNGGLDLTLAIDGGNLVATADGNTQTITVSGNAAADVFGTATTAAPTNTDLAALDGDDLTIQVGTGTAQTFSFTADTTKADLEEWLGGLSLGAGITIGLSAGGEIEVDSTSAQSITFGGDAAAALGLDDNSGVYQPTATVTPNTTRADLQTQYNDLLSQIDTLARDASYNGINLLSGDNLKVVFNEDGSSALDISGVDFTSAGLGLSALTGDAFQSNTDIDAVLSSIDSALSTLRGQAASFGSNLTTVQIRQDFTKNMVNTLQVGADNLVLADTNEEGANLLALQTRQQLSTTALSLSAQADQAVLRLF